LRKKDIVKIMKQIFLICLLAFCAIESKVTNDALESLLKDQVEEYVSSHSDGKSKDPFFYKWFHRRFFGHRKPECRIPKECETSLPQDDRSEKCMAERAKDKLIARAWYQITTPELAESERKTEFPLTTIPWLNQAETSTKFYYAVEPFLSRHLTLLSAINSVYAVQIKAQLIEMFKNVKPDNLEVFKTIAKSVNGAIASLKIPHYFDNPSLHLETFTDHIDNDAWKEDKVFSQSLLSNDLPWSVKKVTLSGTVGIKLSDLVSMLNMQGGIDFDAEISKCYGEQVTLKQAVEKGILFAVHYSQLDGIKNDPDFHAGETGTSTIDENTSPIAILCKTKEKELKVAAIQLDYLPTSKVLTPDTSVDWLKAKATINMAKTHASNGYYHLGQCHFIATIFCTTFRRHFATKHPLYEVLKHHCEGSTSMISINSKSLLSPGGFIHEGFGIGVNGVRNASQQAWDDRNFGQMDFPTLMKQTGIEKDEFKSYPYLEDGELLWKEYGKFTNDLVKTFYYWDSEVRKDTELQSFAKELSPEGIVDFTGFPSKIESTTQLANVLRSIFWYNAIHAPVNYGVPPVFLPNVPYKLYTDNENPSFLSLGNSHHAVSISIIANQLGSVRANRLMAYYNKVQDEKLRNVVRKSYSRLHGCIQKTLEDRNAERKKNGQPGAQYLEPKWMTNSIHI